MRLKPLHPHFKAKMERKLSKLISKDFKNTVLSEEGEVRSLIILGNGNIDDLVIPIICHHLNGEKTIGIVKPINPRIGAISELSVVVPRLSVNKIALVMDQESDELEELYRRIEDKLRRMNVKFEREDIHRRLLRYTCRLGPREFELILIISGIDDAPSEMHKIEDHLLKALSELSKTEYRAGDSKKVWRGLGTSTQRNVLLKLKGTRKLCLDIFFQHSRGLKFLE
ncbi:hypothetical protein [Candidatus Pyrohabitans sp.]